MTRLAIQEFIQEIRWYRVLLDSTRWTQVAKSLLDGTVWHSLDSPEPTQNPLSERACGLESHLGHRKQLGMP